MNANFKQFARHSFNLSVRAQSRVGLTLGMNAEPRPSGSGFFCVGRFCAAMYHRFVHGYLATMLALFAVCLFVPQAVHAEISADDLKQLGDKSYAVRHAATRKLLADESVSTQDLVKAYTLVTLPEQRQRLITIARHHKVREIRLKRFGRNARLGALGLTHSAVSADEMPKLARSAVRVDKVFAGFPAYVHLEAGDLIIGIQHQPIPNGMTRDQISTHFRNVIQSMPAHKPAEFTVYRGGKQYEVKVELASLDALTEMYLPEGLQHDYQKQWDAFYQSMVGEKE